MPELGAVEAALRAKRASGAKLLVPYVTGGLRADWLDVLRAMVDAGADAVEVGIPFSDPVMDGPTIQQASAAALARGTTPASVLTELRAVDVEVPLVAMTYYNLAFRMGDQRFAAELAEAGVGGVVLPDLPMEEQGPWSAAAATAGIATVQLAGPITPDERIKLLCERAGGFLYGVNLMGVTGERAQLGEQSATLARRLKGATEVPVLMGFGVSTPEQAVEVAAPADGVIVASAIMRRILDGGAPADAGRFVATLRQALDEA